jgi:hypothetical protein
LLGWWTSVRSPGGCHPDGDRATAAAIAIVAGVTALRQLVMRPGIGSRIAAAVLTIAGLVPLLARLPKVAVVACFDAGHPLYQWVPDAPFTGTAHCLTGPTPAVSWTLMIAATLMVQLLALPLVLGLGAVLVSGARHLVHAAGQALTRALVALSDVLLPARRPVPVYIRVRSDDADLSRANPRRGPPNCF